MKDTNAHKDHRKRLREKVDKYGLEVLADHEILELLLTYVIPRKDTNPIAHHLMEHFGSFSRVMEAEEQELLQVEGIGKESARFIKILFETMDIFHKDKAKTKNYVLNSTFDCVEFFRTQYSVKKYEFMVLACLNKNRKVVKHAEFKGKNDFEMTLNLQDIINKIGDKTISSVILFHTHPDGNPTPSEEDLRATQSIVNTCLSRGIEVEDHIIIAESKHFSMHKKGIISTMRNQFLSAVNIDVGYMAKLKSMIDK